ncbi:uracil-DNA glycosylase [Lysinibacillus contaminans]|uniref:Uracil-DNA glycosylase n=1 Tax=Lysinibacillus contaminans TaxID=1293441 RepID=A0ABR5JWY3_9BACI|nr:YwdI family protein [Lysinibacillus contaminans]KOS66515.1 uracil-DNA glycosylase [Lysinibacillus contaminans]
MISYQAVLQQLEKQLDEAKKAASEQQMRESLTAVRALCDVVLTQSIETSKTQPKHIPQMLTQGPTQQVLYTAKMDEEDGANGDSLFDF